MANRSSWKGARARCLLSAIRPQEQNFCIAWAAFEGTIVREQEKQSEKEKKEESERERKRVMGNARDLLERSRLLMGRLVNCETTSSEGRLMTGPQCHAKSQRMARGQQAVSRQKTERVNKLNCVEGPISGSRAGPDDFGE